MSSNPISNADRKVYQPAHDDPDLARIKDILGYYGSAASYSRACAIDLAVLVKKARSA